MGWASGSEIAEEVWDMFRGLIHKDKKKYANRLIDLFEAAEQTKWTITQKEIR